MCHRCWLSFGGLHAGETVFFGPKSVNNVSWHFFMEIDEQWRLCTIRTEICVPREQRMLLIPKATVGGVPPFSLVCLSHSHE